MTNEKLKEALKFAESLAAGLDYPRAVLGELEMSRRIIDALGGRTPAWSYLKIEIAQPSTLGVSQLYRVGKPYQVHFVGKPVTALEDYLLPALKVYHAALKKEFEAIP